jgi:hypothetical protein
LRGNTTVDARVASLEAQRDVTTVAYSRYGWLLDSGDWARVADETFAADAVQDLGSGMVQTGRAEINAAFARMFAAIESTVHYFSNVTVELLDDSSASCRAILQAWHWTLETSHLGPVRDADFVSVGVYMDEVRLGHEGWRVTHRRRRNLAPGPLGLGTVPPGFAELLRGWGQGDRG